MGLSRDVTDERETSLMTFLSSMMTSFQLKPLPPSLSIYCSHILELSAPSVSLGFDEQCWVSMALFARWGKLIRDQINRAAPEEPEVSLPLLKGCPGWAGVLNVLPGKYTSAAGARPCPCAAGGALPKSLQLCLFALPERTAPAPEKQMYRGC